MSKVAQRDKARFQELMGNTDAFVSIDELVTICDEAAYWSDQFMETVTAQAKKFHIRRLIKSLKEDGWPLWASVETTDEQGNPCRMYKQELLFDIEDYRKVVEYHHDRSNYHRRIATGYKTRCKKRFNVQLNLSFGDDAATPVKPR